MWHIWLLYALLLLLDIACLAATLITLPGLWLILLFDVAFASVTHFRYLGPKMLLALFLATALAEVIDIGMAGVLAKRAGAGRSGVVGALIGGIAGAFFFPLGPLVVVGILAGSFVGAATLEFLFGRNTGASLRIGAAATAGKALGITAKVLLGIVMLILTAIAAFP